MNEYNSLTIEITGNNISPYFKSQIGIYNPFNKNRNF